MKRSELPYLPEYFDRYIMLCDDVTVSEVFDTALAEFEQFPLAKWHALGEKVYAEGKWTIHDILQHWIDTARVFTYRALAFARGDEQQMPPFDEDGFALQAQATRRSLEDLIAELRLVYQSMQVMYQSFTPEILAREGQGFKGKYTVASIAFIMAGHIRWHLRILEERYYPLFG